MGQANALGKDTKTNELIYLGETERQAGVYILGKPGMGKTTTIENMIDSDIRDGHGIFFIDPHGDAVDNIISKTDGSAITEDALIFDLEDEHYSIGINLLSCRKEASSKERRDTYTRAYNIFHKLWEASWGLHIQSMLENTLPVFIGNQDYTIAEIPLFLMNGVFRSHLLTRTLTNPLVLDFWTYDFGTKNDREQREMVQPLLTRLNQLLSIDIVRHVICQSKTTVNFSELIAEKKIILFKFPTHLSADVKRFLGTIILSEFLHAVRKRQELPPSERHFFAVYIDEFQHFARNEDMATLITEARKYGIGSTFAHQERFGQFADNQTILGATGATANKILFQLTPRDAAEFAPEFAEEATVDTKPQAHLAVSPHPFWDLVERGHGNQFIQECVDKWFIPIVRSIDHIKTEIEILKVRRQAYQDEATLHRDLSSIASLEERGEALNRREDMARRHSLLGEAQGASANMMAAHEKAGNETSKLKMRTGLLAIYQQEAQIIDEFLYNLMSGKVSMQQRDERIVEYFALLVFRISRRDNQSFRSGEFYLHLMFGDDARRTTVPCWLAVKLWPNEVGEWFVRYETDRCMQAQTSCPASWKKSREELSKEAREFYRKSRIIEGDDARTKLHYKGGLGSTGEVGFPDITRSAITSEEKAFLINACRGVIREEKHEEIAKLIKFCETLTRPENVVRIASHHYVDQPVHRRSVRDMVDEMSQNPDGPAPVYCLCKTPVGECGTSAKAQNACSFTTT